MRDFGSLKDRTIHAHGIGVSPYATGGLAEWQGDPDELQPRTTRVHRGHGKSALLGIPKASDPGESLTWEEYLSREPQARER